jgi:hypothetical protein
MISDQLVDDLIMILDEWIICKFIGDLSCREKERRFLLEKTREESALS